MGQAKYLGRGEYLSENGKLERRPYFSAFLSPEDDRSAFNRNLTDEVGTRGKRGGKSTRAVMTLEGLSREWFP